MKFFGDLAKFEYMVADAGINLSTAGAYLADASNLSEISSMPTESGILIAQNDSQDKVVRRVLTTGIGHYVQYDHPDWARELVVADAMIGKRVDFFSEPHMTLLDPTGRRRVYGWKTFKFTSSRQKKETIQLLMEAIRPIGARHLLEMATIIADELFTNAVFNAPVDASGKPLHSHKKRSEEVVIDSPAQLFMANDNDWLVIGAMDPFGSLDPRRLLQRLDETYSGAQARVRSTGGGAGLGCRLIFDYGSSMYVGVEKRKKTVMACKLPLKRALRAAQAMPKNLHVF